MEQTFPLFPEAASTMARRVDEIYFYLLAVSGFFSLLICVLIVVFATRYRRGRAGDVATHIHGSNTLEIVWCVIPLVLVMVMFGWGAKVYFELSRPPAGAIDVHVVGKQWMWKLQHPGGQREINQLHIGVNQPVRLIMTSEDVIHSFYVPAFRMKRDVLPGRYSIAWFEATVPGTYHLFCAEYCGTKHSGMIGQVVVLDPLDYERWLENAPRSATPREAGERLFQAMRCDTCHGATDGERGPALAGLYGRPVRLEGGGTAVADEDYLRESILAPNARVTQGWEATMPSYAGQLGEDQILELVAYIRSLEAPQEPR